AGRDAAGLGVEPQHAAIADRRKRIAAVLGVWPGLGVCGAAYDEKRRGGDQEPGFRRRRRDAHGLLRLNGKTTRLLSYRSSRRTSMHPPRWSEIYPGIVATYGLSKQSMPAETGVARHGTRDLRKP